MKYLIMVLSNPESAAALRRLPQSRAGSSANAHLRARARRSPTRASSSPRRASTTSRSAVRVRVRDGETIDDRRPVRRGEGAAGRVLPGRVRQPRTGVEHRRPGARRRVQRRRGAAGARPARPGDVTPPEIEQLLRELAPRCSAALVAPLRRLRHVRGRRAGGPARRGHAVAGRGGAGQPAGLAGHGRVAAADRAVARRHRRGAASETAAALEPPRTSRRPADATTRSTLLLLCCHPALTRPRRSRSRCARSAA